MDAKNIQLCKMSFCLKQFCWHHVNFKKKKCVTAGLELQLKGFVYAEKRYLSNSNLMHITKTRLYNFDPLKPHFYIVKLGFTGVYIIFLISAQNIDCGYSLEPPCRGGSNEYPQSMFWAEIWKISEFLSENFQVFFEVKFSIYLNRRVFVMSLGDHLLNCLVGQAFICILSPFSMLQYFVNQCSDERFRPTLSWTPATDETGELVKAVLSVRPSVVLSPCLSFNSVTLWNIFTEPHTHTNFDETACQERQPFAILIYLSEAIPTNIQNMLLEVLMQYSCIVSH